MRDSTYNFLLSIGVPDVFNGFELLGEALEIMGELMSQGKRIYPGDICEQLGEAHGITATAADRAMRRCIDGIVRHSYVIPNPMPNEVMGGSYRQMYSLWSFLFSCASCFLNREGAEE